MAAAAPGGKIDRYELTQTLGHGAMGVVYLARDTKLEREVALKLIHPNVAATDVARSLFHREAKAIAKLQHPSIIQLFDYSGRDSRVVYLVVERLRGRNLFEVMEARQRLQLGPFDALTAAAVGHEICLALAHAHDEGIVHRDLKPENVFLEPDGRVVLCDFGVARAYRSTVAHTLASQQTQLAGSPLYMSPEQIEDPQSIGPPSDLFSLGSLLYYLTTGSAAFSGPNIPKILKAVIEGTPRVPLDKHPQVPPAYVQIVSRLLERDPARRPAKAAEVADALLAMFQPTGHRDPRRLLKAASDELGAHQTMVMLRPKRTEDEEIPREPTRPWRRQAGLPMQQKVLLAAVGLAFGIMILALFVREVDAMEPLRAWIRDWLRKY